MPNICSQQPNAIWGSVAGLLAVGLCLGVPRCQSDQHYPERDMLRSARRLPEQQMLMLRLKFFMAAVLGLVVTGASAVPAKAVLVDYNIAFSDRGGSPAGSGILVLDLPAFPTAVHSLD